MNKIIYITLLAALFFSCLFNRSEALPLNLAKTTKKLLSIIGQATYYDVAAGLGSCGELSSNSDMVVAVNTAQMKNGANPNKNPHCNKQVTIVGPKGTCTGTVVDTCPGCKENSLDVSEPVFQAICGALSLGVCQISWDFL